MISRQLSGSAMALPSNFHMAAEHFGFVHVARKRDILWSLDIRIMPIDVRDLGRFSVLHAAISHEIGQVRDGLNQSTFVEQSNGKSDLEAVWQSCGQWVPSSPAARGTGSAHSISLCAKCMSSISVLTMVASKQSQIWLTGFRATPQSKPPSTVTALTARWTAMKSMRLSGQSVLECSHALLIRLRF
jgi:hypothetical protein